MTQNKLTVLFVPINYVGPVLASIGMAEVLRDAGHRPVFAVNSDWKTKIQSVGFELEILGINGNDSPDNDSQVTDSADANVEELNDILDNMSPVDKYVSTFTVEMFDIMIANFEREDPYLRSVIDRVKPDVIIADTMTNIPAICLSGIPWIMSYSSNPLSLDLAIDDNRLPPSLLGMISMF